MTHLPTRRRRTALLISAAGALAVLLATPVSAQLPDHFTNLQVLPKDMAKEQLVGVMRSWSVGLGQHCDFCHAEAKDTKGMDFASDEKAEKKTARQMLQMVQAINKQYLANLPTAEAEMPAPTLTCYTCHHGQAEPPLAARDVLSKVALADGAAAAVARFKTLRAEHPDDGTYDVSEHTLPGVAFALADADKAADALAVLQANLEIFPASADTHVMIGRLALDRGDKAAAAEAFKKALAIDGDSESAQRGLARATAADAPVAPPKP